MRYPIVIEPGDDAAAFGVVVPDLPGCFSGGDTLDEAICTKGFVISEGFIGQGECRRQRETPGGNPYVIGGSPTQPFGEKVNAACSREAALGHDAQQ